MQQQQKTLETQQKQIGEMIPKIGNNNVTNVNNVNKRKRTPLHEAIVQDQKNSNCNKLQIVKLLNDKGANINTQSKENKYAFCIGK